MSLFAIRHRFTGAVLFEAELSDEFETAPASVRLGAAAELALKSGASLYDANLRGASLYGANLRGADLSGVDCLIDAGLPNGWTAIGWLRGGWLIVKVGCREKRLAEGRAYWSAETHHDRENRREVLAALDYIEAVAKLRGWAVKAPADGEGR